MTTLSGWPQGDMGRAVSPSKMHLDSAHDIQVHKGQVDAEGVGRRCLVTEDAEVDASGLIKAHAGSPAPSMTPAMDPLQQDQQDWLDHQRQTAAVPSLPEFHLSLPAAHELPAASSTAQGGTLQSAFANFQALDSPWKLRADASGLSQQDGGKTPDLLAASSSFLPQSSIASEDSQEDGERKLLRHASTIKPRDRLARKLSGKLSGQRNARALGASRGSSSSGGSADITKDHRERPMADGVMMLLQACEALDMNASRLSGGSASASPRRPPRPRNAPAADLQRIRASFSRALSDSLVPLPPQAPSSRRGGALSGGYEKENALSLLGPARKSGGHSGTLSPKPPRPVKPRKSRSELHGPCCHCMATESPQWRKGPKCKPILCNACGTRFLRTRSLGKSTGKGGSKKVGGFSSASSCNLDDDAAPMEVEMGEDEHPHIAPPNHLHQDNASALDNLEQDGGIETAGPTQELALPC